MNILSGENKVVSGTDRFIRNLHFNFEWKHSLDARFRAKNSLSIIEKTQIRFHSTFPVEFYLGEFREYDQLNTACFHASWLSTRWSRDREMYDKL